MCRIITATAYLKAGGICNHCQGFVRITAGCHVVADVNIQLLDPPEMVV